MRVYHGGPTCKAEVFQKVPQSTKARGQDAQFLDDILQYSDYDDSSLIMVALKLTLYHASNHPINKIYGHVRKQVLDEMVGMAKVGVPVALAVAVTGAAWAQLRVSRMPAGRREYEHVMQVSDNIDPGAVGTSPLMGRPKTEVEVKTLGEEHDPKNGALYK